MKRILLFLLFVPWMTMGQALDQMRQITNAVASDLMLIQTNSAGSPGQKFTGAITLSNLLEVLAGFDNFPDSGGGNATNAQPPTTGLTNLSIFLAAGLSNRLAITDTRGYLTNAPNVYYASPGVHLYNLSREVPAGSTIILGTGVHTNGATNLFFNGSWIGDNATLRLIDIPTNTTGGGIFDDRWSGAVTCLVSGTLEIQYTPGTNVWVDPADVLYGYNTNALGAIVVTNRNTFIGWSAHTRAGVFGPAPIPKVIYVKDCQTNSFFHNFDEVYFWKPAEAGSSNNLYWITLRVNHLGAGDLVTSIGSSFMRWNEGTMDCTYGSGYVTDYWLDCYNEKTNSTELRIQGNRADGKQYIVGSTNTWKVWHRALEMLNTSGNANAINCYGAGSHYFEAQKISSRLGPVIQLENPAFPVDTNLTVWVNFDKMSASNGWALVKHGTLRGRIGHLHQNGPTDGTAGLSVTNISGEIILSGETMASDQRAVYHGGGKMDLSGFSIATTNQDAIFVASSGLKLRDVSVIATATNSIRASSAQTVTDYGSTMTNIHANVTVTRPQPLGHYAPAFFRSTVSVDGNQTNSGNFGLAGTMTIQGGLAVVGALAETSTNMILSLTEDTTPDSADYFPVANHATAALRKIALNNFPTHAQLVTASNAVSGVSNLFSPTLSNTTIKPLVVGVGTAAGATNITGQIRGIEAGANVSLTENGSNVVIAASVSGSGATTNGTQFGTTADGQLSLKSGIMLTNVDALNITNRGTFNQTGTSLFVAAVTNNDRVWLNERINQVDPANSATFGQLRAQTLLITNLVRILATNLNAAGTNLVADGNLSSVFTNAINGRTAGVTNIVVTNILDGQTMTIGIWATNGTTVQLCTAPGVQIPDAWYTDGVAITVNTNGFTWVEIKRYGGWTNVTQVLTPSFAFQPGPQMTYSTNFATRTITQLLPSYLTNGSTGSGAVVLSNAPSVFGANLLSDTILVASNANNAILRAANSNSVPTTNIFGITHKAAATPLILDANHGRNFTITNRYGAASTIVLTNTWDGTEVTIVAIGEVSGGTSRVITLIGNGGGSAAIANLDTFGTAIAASMAFTLTNGNAVEISARTTRMLQSNVTAVVTRQFAF